MKELSTVLWWCLLLNYLVLILWFVAFVFGHDLMYRVHSRWFRVSVERYDMAHLVAISVYKVVIIAFNLVPAIALYLTDK